MGHLIKSDWQLAQDTAKSSGQETTKARAFNVGMLMEEAMEAAGTKPFRQGGAYACETDYLAARGAIFPDVPREELEKFNKETLSEFMNEQKEFARYCKIASFFRQTTPEEATRH